MVDRLFDDVWRAAQVGMRTMFVPHSDLPSEQVGHTLGEPDAVVQRLAEVHDVVRAWRSAAQPSGLRSSPDEVFVPHS